MKHTMHKDQSFDRLALPLIGAAAGGAFWLFVDVLPEIIHSAHLLIFSAAITLSFFAITMALFGPVRLAKSLIAALCLSLPTSLLLLWKSFSIEAIEIFTQNGFSIVAFFIIIIVGTPFIAAELKQKNGWRSYPLLFDIAWLIVVRFFTALVFTGVFWAVFMLSNELLEIVGIPIIKDLIQIDFVPFVLSGAVFGLALAVVHELSDYISPFLIIRLVRLLLPIVLVVVSVFLIAVPMRGISNLFGNFSSAATLMAMAWAAITLITTSIDRSDNEAATNRAMRLMTMGLAALLPAIALMSVYAVWLRISQYGLTPDRIIAVIISMLILGYSVSYLVSLMYRKKWMEHIRQSNRKMALILIGLCALWLTPVLNAERISTKSQVTRFKSGRVDVDDLALWEMSHDWGEAGLSGIESLRSLTDHSQYTALSARIDRAISSKSKYAFNDNKVEARSQKTARELFANIAVRPKGATLSSGIFADISSYNITRLDNGCKRTLPDGRAACVAITAIFNPALDGRQTAFLFLEKNGRVMAFSTNNATGVIHREKALIDLTTGHFAVFTKNTIARILDGEFSIGPAKLQSLKVGDMELFLNN